MKRFSIVLIVVLLLTSSIAQGAGARKASVGDVVIAPSNATPKWRRIAYRNCNGTNDEVELQAGIDFAIGGRVILAPGDFSVAAPIYVGYTGGVPRQNVGCEIVGAGGDIKIIAAGSDELQFICYYAPTSGGSANGIRSVYFIAENWAGGVFGDNVTGCHFSNMRIRYGEVAGMWLSNSWTSRLSRLLIQDQDGICLGLQEFNAGVADQINVFGLTMDALKSGNGGVKRYFYDSADPAFYFGEKVQIAAADRGVVLDVDTIRNFVYIGHGSKTAFSDEDTITGEDSSATCDIETSTPVVDIGCGLWVDGSQGKVSNVNIENCTMDDGTDDFPLVLVISPSAATEDSRQITFEQFRFEAGLSDPFNRGQAETYFRFINCDGCIVRDVQITTWPTGLRDTSVTVNGNGDGTSAVTSMPSTALWEVGDTVHLWSGGGDDGDYTVSVIDSATAFTISDGDFTETPMSAYNLTSANRICPEEIVDAQDCKNLLVENLHYSSVYGHAINLDSDCKHCVLRNVNDYRASVSSVLLITGRDPALANAFVSNASVQLQVLGLIPQSNVAVNGYPADFTLYDGAIVASAGTLDISSTWGPRYQAYISGTTAVTVIQYDGAVLGQVITLTATHVATGFVLTDDDDNIDLEGTTTSITLNNYESISLVCIDATEDAQKWQEVGYAD